MATDYGTDLLALDDLLDPEQLVTDELNVAYALARRVATPTDAMVEIGDLATYDTINIRDWLGARFNLNDNTVIDDLQQQARAVLVQDPRVDTVSVVASFNQGTLSLTITGTGAAGPFGLVVAAGAAGVTVTLLRGT